MAEREQIDDLSENLDEAEESANASPYGDNNNVTEVTEDDSSLVQNSNSSQTVTPRTKLRLVKFLSSSSLKKRQFKPCHCKYCAR